MSRQYFDRYQFFVEDGKFEIMPGAKRQLMEIEGQLGMMPGTLAKMALNSADLGAKLEQIKFPEFLSEDQKTFFANLAEKDTDGIYKITIDDKKVGLSEALEKYGTSPEKLKELQEATRPKDIVDLAKEQLSTSKDIYAVLNSMKSRTGLALAGSKPGQNIMEMFRSAANMVSKSVPKEFSVKGIKKSSGDMTDAIVALIEKSKKGEISSTELTLEMGSLLKSGFEKFAEIGTTFGGNVEKEFKKAIENADIFSALNTKKVKDFVVTPNGVIETHEQDTIIGMTKGEELFKGLGNNNNNNNKTTTNTTTSSTIDVNLNHTVTINAPAGVDTQQLVLALKNDEIKQSIVKSVLRGMTNDGRTASNSNPQQIMNSFMNLA